VISTSLKKLRSAGILLLALLFVSLGVRPAQAAGDDNAGDDNKAPASDSGSAPAPAAVPQLQLEDEGPSAREQKKTHANVRLAAPLPTDDQDDKPFYKSPVFWAVTGVLVAGAIGAVIYSTSGTRGSLQPCPATVTLSLGCYGAGRN
jgi:hypothetical protein